MGSRAIRINQFKRKEGGKKWKGDSKRCWIKKKGKETDKLNQECELIKKKCLKEQEEK